VGERHRLGRGKTGGTLVRCGIVALLFWGDGRLSAAPDAAASPIPAAAGAAAEDGGPALTWADCVRRSAAQNPDLLAAQKTRDSRRSQYYGNVNGLLPGVSLSNSYSESNNGARSSRWQTRGSAQWDLFNLKSYASVRSASASLAQADAGLRLASAEVRSGLRKAFAQLLFAQEQVSVAQRIRDVRSNNARMVSLKYQSGRESKGNMLQAQAELAEAEAELAQARRVQRVARQSLNRWMGQDDFSAVSVTGSFDTKALPARAEVETAVSGHPRLAQLEASRNVARASVQNAWGGVWPTLSAGYGRSWTGPDEFPDETTGWNVSGTLSLPLFSGGPTSAFHSVSSARRNLEKSEQDLRAGRQQLRADLETAWSDLAGKIDRVDVQKKFLEAARQRNDEALVRYSNGLMTFENWEQVVSGLVSSERGALQSRRDAVLAEAAWEQSLGRGLEEP